MKIVYWNGKEKVKENMNKSMERLIIEMRRREKEQKENTSKESR